VITTDTFEWIVEDLTLAELKQEVADTLDDLDYAQAMGWDDRVQEAIESVWELVA
jgi:hypothetical protein